MKIPKAVILTALFIACPATAQQATNTPSVSATVAAEKPEFHWFASAETKKSNKNLERVEGLDPRAWTTVVGWHPGESAFVSAETHEAGWPLFWVSF